MTKYKSLEDGISVNKQTVISVIKALPVGEKMRKDLLKRNNIEIDSDAEWFSQQDWLNCFSDIQNLWGERVLFLIGRAIVRNAKFPKINSLKDALEKLDIAYHLNHCKDNKIMYDADKNFMMEGIGHYKLVKYDENEKKAIVVCDNPYPSMFDLGILDELVKRFSMDENLNAKVYLDSTKETRRTGGKTCTYIVEWE